MEYTQSNKSHLTSYLVKYKFKAFPLISGIRKESILSSLLLNSFESYNQTKWSRKYKMNPNWKEKERKEGTNGPYQWLAISMGRNNLSATCILFRNHSW